jgi:hypothetical protein
MDGIALSGRKPSFKRYGLHQFGTFMARFRILIALIGIWSFTALETSVASAEDTPCLNPPGWRLQVQTFELMPRSADEKLGRSYVDYWTGEEHKMLEGRTVGAGEKLLWNAVGLRCEVSPQNTSSKKEGYIQAHCVLNEGPPIVLRAGVSGFSSNFRYDLADQNLYVSVLLTCSPMVRSGHNKAAHRISPGN